MPEEDIADENARRYVLLVEDEILIRAPLAEELRDRGLIVVEAGSAEEAWAYLAGGGHVDLLFTDVHMPGAFNGAELASRVLKQRPSVPVVVASGAATRDLVHPSATFYPKPFPFDDAVTLVLAKLGQV